MPLPMKENIFNTFWKFCFRKPDNQNCMNNLTNNRLILEIIAEDNPQILEKIKTEEALKSISNNEYCVMNCCFFVSKFPKIYDFLSDEIKLCIDNLIEKYQKIKIFSWYKNTDKSNHIKRMIEEEIFDVDDFGIMQYVKESYSAEGLADVLCDYCIKAFSKSNSFNQADLRYTMHIKPNLDLFTKEQFIEILNIINSNAKIYNRGASYVSNTEIINNICLPAKVPVVAGEQGICAGCGIATLSISYYDIGYKAGEMAYDILENGKDISTMEIETAPNVTKMYNPTICEELGIEVPDEYEAIEQE